MKTLALILSQLICVFEATSAAEEKPAVTSQKLADLLGTQDKDGKSVISPGQRTYAAGLNDHLKALLVKAVEAEIITRADHLGSILELQLPPQKMEVLLQDNCLLCHTDPEVQQPRTLFSLAPVAGASPAHLNLRGLVDDVHFRRGLSCAGCHGGDPASDKLEHSFVKEWPSLSRETNRAWVVTFCGRCHSDPTFMNRFNPALPTDQLAKFKESPHGKLLLETNDPRAPDCLSCHRVHAVRSAKNPLSTTDPKHVHETCGACHGNPKTMAGFRRSDGSPIPTNQVAEYRASVHGRALLERGDRGAPTCTTCHGSHASMPAGLASVAQSCALCHAGNASLFDGSKHKQAFEAHQWPQCAKCHGHHGIAKPGDWLLEPGAAGALCTDCHLENARHNPDCLATAASFWVSLTKMDKARKDFDTIAEQLAAKGLDVDPIHDKLNELTDTLKQARSQIHSFSKASFERVATPGDQASRDISTLVEEARREYRLRQYGLLTSIGLTGVVILAIYLKLRRLER